MFRTAASFIKVIKVIGGLNDRPLLIKSDMIQKNDRQGGILIVSSHTAKTTEQLEQLKDLDYITFIEFNSDLVLQDKLEEEVNRVVDKATQLIPGGITVAAYTKRTVLTLEDDTPEQALLRSVKISEAVQALVGRSTVQPSFVIAKGGITSSDVGVKALQVKKALVLGQIKPGIPVWKTDATSKFPGIPYIIFPGNVGEKNTLKEVVEILQPANPGFTPENTGRKEFNMKLCTLHTTDKFMELMSEPFTKPFLKEHPEIEQMDITDSSLIKETQAAGYATPAVARRMYNYMMCAADAGADAILVTCTSVNTVTKAIRSMIPIPVISIEEPVAQKAVKAGKRIGILSSLATSAQPVKQTILEEAAKAGKEAEVRIQVADGAFEALMEGSRALHDEKVREALAELVNEVDIVVFAQISMALVEHPEYKIPVLKFGRLSYEAAREAMLASKLK